MNIFFGFFGFLLFVYLPQTDGRKVQPAPYLQGNIFLLWAKYFFVSTKEAAFFCIFRSYPLSLLSDFVFFWVIDHELVVPEKKRREKGVNKGVFFGLGDSLLPFLDLPVLFNSFFGGLWPVVNGFPLWGELRLSSFLFSHLERFLHPGLFLTCISSDGEHSKPMVLYQLLGNILELVVVELG